MHRYFPRRVTDTDVSAHERRQGRVEGLERGDGAELAPIDPRAGRALGEKAGQSLDLGQLGHASILPRPGRPRYAEPVVPQ